MSNKAEEFQLLNQLLANISQKISFNYHNRIPTLIISITNNDIALAGIIQYFQVVTKQSKDVVLEALKYKIPNLPDLGSKVSEYLQMI